MPAANIKAVVLAGGRGTRLAPFTSVLPKPLMPIGDRAILEIVVDQLVEHGISEIVLCVGHLSHLIRAVFSEGRAGGPDLRFVQEHEALGTAGPLRLVDDLDDTFVVLNGDVLTTLDFADLVRQHKAGDNGLTIAAHVRTLRMDYGVIRHSGDDPFRVSEYQEKPELPLTVSMGVYVMEPRVLEYVPDGYFDFPDLVKALLAAGEPVGTYLYDGLWLDIGLRADYEKAVEMWEG